MDSNAIALDGVSHQFGGRLAVNDLSFEVLVGSVFGFLGPNGAGKTTTINLLLGLLKLQTGRINVLGIDVAREPGSVRDNIGALLEYDGLYEQLSASDNLEFYGRVWRMPTGQRRERTRELLSNMQLWDRRDEPVSKWSRGMRRRLALARALLHRPRVVILDEPTAGLDVIHATHVRHDLEALSKNEQVTVFLTTHNMSEAEELCSRIAVIRAGELIGLGTPSELRAAARAPTLVIDGRDFPLDVEPLLKQLPFVDTVAVEQGSIRVTLTGAADSSAIVSSLVRAGAKVESVRQDSPSLEQAFLTLVTGEHESEEGR